MGETGMDGAELDGTELDGTDLRMFSATAPLVRVGTTIIPKPV